MVTRHQTRIQPLRSVISTVTPTLWGPLPTSPCASPYRGDMMTPSFSQWCVRPLGALAHRSHRCARHCSCTMTEALRAGSLDVTDKGRTGFLCQHTPPCHLSPENICVLRTSVLSQPPHVLLRSRKPHASALSQSSSAHCVLLTHREGSGGHRARRGGAVESGRGQVGCVLSPCPVLPETRGPHSGGSCVCRMRRDRLSHCPRPAPDHVERSPERVSAKFLFSA